MKRGRCLLAVLAVALLFLLSSCIVFGSPLAIEDHDRDTERTEFLDADSLPESESAKIDESVSEEESVSTSEEGDASSESEEGNESQASQPSATDKDPDSKEEANKPKPPTDFYERLIYENLISNVLSEKSDLLVVLESEEDEDSYWYYTQKDDSLWLDASWYSKASQKSTVYSIRGNAYYSFGESAPVFFVIPDDSPDCVAELFGMGVFASDAEYLGKNELDGGLVECVAQLDAPSTASYDYVLYTYVADAETLLLKSAEVEWIDGDGAIESELLTFSYDVESFTADTSAYDLHSAAADRITLRVYDEDGTTSVYTLAENTEIGACNALDGAEYALYKNEERTKDVSDLSMFTDGTATLYLGKWFGDVSFEFTLVEEDVDRFRALLSEFETLAKQSTSDTSEAFKAYGEMRAMFEYVRTQSSIAYVNYYSDLADPVYRNQYSFADSTYSLVYSNYYAALARINATDSPFKAEFFSDWTDEELSELTRDYSGISDLQNANNDLLVSYFDLDESNAGWGAAVNEIYEQFIQNANQIAHITGYDNYYEYASSERYNRDYSKTQRENFRAYVKEYIVPLYGDCRERLSAAVNGLNSMQIDEVNALLFEDYREIPLAKAYLSGYFGGFHNELGAKLSSMLKKNSMVISDAPGAYRGAFSTYFDYYEEPIVYFHKDSLDLLTLIHENGHYAAYYGIGGDGLPGLDLCETHSQGNEWMFIAYLKDASALNADVYEVFLLQRLLTGLQSIVLSTLIDECEESFYSAETPFESDEFDDEIKRIENTYGAFAGKIDVVRYFKQVALSSPAYYISYATSELVSISLYAKADEDFDSAKDAFFVLLNEADADDTFLASVAAAGLPSPFEASTFVEFDKTIGSIVGSASDYTLRAA